MERNNPAGRATYRRYALFCILLFQFLIAAGQSTFYSQGSGLFGTLTNWDTNPLGGGTDPVAADLTNGLNNFIIQDGHTVSVNNNPDVFDLNVGTGTSGTLTIGSVAGARTIIVRNNLNVASGASVNVASFASTHSLSLYGNLVVNGSFDMVQTFPGNVCNVTFMGATSNTVTGSGATCNFNQITVNKGASAANIIDVQRAFTMSSPTAASNFLTINNGTFELSGTSAVSITPYFGSQTISAANGRLWINNPNASVSCVGTMTTASGVPTVTGILQVTQGVFAYGSGNDVMTLNAATSNLTIDGGTVNMYGGAAFTGTSQLNMTSGNFNLDPQAFDNLAAGTSILNFSSTNAANAVTFTGGTLTIVDPHSASGGGYAITMTGTAGYAYNFAGSNINFGDGSSNSNGNATDGFDINGGNQYALGNIILNNGTSTGTDRFVRLVTSNCIIGGNLSIGNNTNDDFRLNTRTLSLKGNITNNGTFTSTGAGSALQMTGTVQQIISGSGIFTDGTAGRILSLTINNTSGTSPAVDLQTNLSVATGGGALTLTNGDFGTSNASIFTIGAGAAGTITTTRTDGTMSLIPSWNIVAGVPGYNLVYNTSAAALTTGNEMPSSSDAIINNITVNNNSGVLIGENDITIQGTLTLTNGVVDFQDKTVNFVTSGAPLARTNGTITTSASGTINFGTPALMTGGNITIPPNTFTNNPVQIGDLAINKSASHTLAWNNQGLTISGTLTLNLTGATKVFSIGGNTLTFQDDDTPVVRTSGTISTAAGTILKFGDTGHTGGAAFALPAALFTGTPSITSLTVDRDNKLTWTTQALTLSNTLNLVSGEFDFNGQTLTTNANIPFTRTTGTFTPGASCTLSFTANANPFTFPDDFFTTSPATIATLTLNRGAGVLMTLGNQELNVTGTTTLTAGTGGILEIKDADLQIAATLGTPSANSMIVTNGTGFLKRTFPAGASAAFTFPIGDNTGGVNEYSPARFTFSANTTAGTLGVKVTDAKHPANTEPDNFITRYWSFNTPLLTTYTYSAQFTYPAADVVGTDEANFRMQRYDNGLSTWKSDVGSITVPGANSTLTTSSLTEITGWLNNNDITSFTAPETYYWSRNTGVAWNAATAWVVTDVNVDPGAGGTPTSVVPDRSNNKGITIRSGHTITVNAGTYTADQLTVAAGGTLALGANNLTLYNGLGTDLTVDGTLTTNGGQLVSAEADIAIALNGTLNTSDADGFAIDANSTIPTTNSPAITLGANSTINFSGAAGQKIDTRTDYANLQATNAGAKIAQGAITVNKDLTVNNASFDQNGNTITLKGGATFTGTGTMSGTGLLLLTGGSASHTIAGNNATFINLELDDANGAAFSGATNIISGNLVVTRGTLVLNAFTTLTVSGTTTIGAGANPAAIAINSNAGTKIFTGLITVGANGTWNNSANESFTIRGSVVNSGTFTAGTGTYTFDTSDQSLTGNFVIPNVTITGVTLTNNNSLTVATALGGATGILTQASSATLNIGVAGAVTLGTLNADASGNTVTYNSPAGNQTIKIPSVAYYHLGMSGTGIKTLPGALSVLGDLTVGAGTLAFGANSIQLNGNLVNNGLHTATTGALILTGGTATHNISGTGTSFNITLNDPNGATLLSNVQVNGTLTLTNGVIHLGAYDLTLGSTIPIGGTFSSSSMIETGGSGRLIRSASANNSTFNLTYPVGSGGFYNPMVVSGLAGVGVNPKTFAVRAIPSNPGILTNGINKYWELSANNILTPGMVLSFAYNAGEVVGNSLLFQPYTNTSGTWTLAPGPSLPGSNPATSTGSAAINGSWTVGAPSTFYSYQTGPWNLASTWTFDPGGTTGPGTLVPGQNDKVVILSGRTVSLTANVFTQNLDITINNGGILDQGTRRFTNTLAALRGDGVLKLASAFFPNTVINTFVTTDGGITEYNNDGSMSSTQSTYYHLVIRTTGTVTPVNDLTLNGNLDVKLGVFEINDDFDGRLKMIIKGDFNVDIPGVVSVAPLDTRSDIGPIPPIDGSTGGYLNYYENNSHRIELFGNFKNNGTVRFSNLTYPVYDEFPSDGFATVYFRGLTDNTLTCNGQTDFYNLIIDKGNDQTYKVTLYSSAYSNFRLFGANTASAGTPSLPPVNPDIKKALWIKNGTFILQGMTVIPSLSEGNTAISAPNYFSSDYIIPSKAALVLDGPGVIVLSTADSYTEVNAAYGLTGGSDADYGINTTGGYSAIVNLGKLQVNEGYLSTRESSGLLYYSYASGQYIINGGKVDTKQFHDPEGGTSGLVSYVQTGGDLTVRGRFTTSFTYTKPEDLTTPDINTTRLINGIDASPGVGAFSINANAANGFTMGGGSITIHDVCNTSATPLAVNISCPSSNVNVTGGTVTIRPTSGAAGDADYLVGSTGPFYNFAVNRKDGSSVVKLNSDLVLLNDFNLISGELTATASNYNLTAGGDFTVSSGTVYDPQSNTTTLNGPVLQTVTIDLAAALTINNLTVQKPAGVILNFAGSQKTVNIAGAFRLENGTMNDSGNTINIAGNIYNSGVHAGTGKIVLNGTTAQTIDGDGIFSSMDLNNTAAATAPVSLLAGIRINGDLNFANDKQFDIGIHNVTLGDTATLLNASGTRYFKTAGNVGDGGLTKVFSSSSSFDYPFGVSDYTPAAITVNGAPASYGSITVIPVNYEHPNVTTTGRTITYFWRTKSTGFNLTGGSVTHKYTYAAADEVITGDVTTDGYVAARYNVPATTWTKGVATDVDEVNRVIGGAGSGGFLENSSVIDGDYTCGDDNATNPFGVPTTYYSIADGQWANGNTWSTVSHVGAPAGTWPGASDIAIIASGDSIYLYNNAAYPLNTAIVSCATLMIEAGGVLDIGNNPGSVFGMVQSHPAGNGKFRITATPASAAARIQQFGFPAGDFSDFNINLGTTDFYTTANYGLSLYILPPISYVGNMIMSPRGIPTSGDNMALQNVSSLTIFGDLTVNGASYASVVALSWNTNDGFYSFSNKYLTVEKTVTIKGDLNINGGAFTFYDDDVPQHLIIDGDINISNKTNGACIIAWDSEMTPWTPYHNGPTVTNTLVIGGSVNNNGVDAATYFRGMNLIRTYTDATPHYVDVTFTGSNNSLVTGSGTYVFNKVIINKGITQSPTITINSTGTFTTNNDNWLTLQNGTLIYNRTGNFNISTGSPFTIAPTAGLTINTPSNVYIGNSSSDANDLILNGKLTIIDGNVFVGPSTSVNFNNDIEYSLGGASAIDIQGGSLTVNGQIRRNPSSAGAMLKYSQSGGSVMIRGQKQNGTNAKLEVLNTGSSFNMSAGTLTIMRGNGTTLTPSSPFGDLYLRPETGSVTGGTIIFSQVGMAPAPVTAQNYFLDATIPLNNVTITGVTAANNARLRLLTSPLTVNGDMTISANCALITNNINTTFNGNLINTPGVTGYDAGTNLTTFSATSGSSYAGAQLITGATNFYDLNVSPDASLTLSNPSTVSRNLTIGKGTFILGGNPVNVKGNFANKGSFTDNNTAGSGILLTGTTQQQISEEGGYARLTINNAAGAVILDDITLQEDLTMTLGIIDIKSNLLTLGTAANLQGAPFSAVKMITSDGVFSDVGLRKYFNAGAATFQYPIGTNGKYTPALVTTTASSTVGYIRINNISDWHPAVLDKSNSLAYYWEIQSSGITGYTGTIELNYLQGDVAGDEPNYMAARTVVPGSSWIVAPGVDFTNNKITFTHTASNNLSGEYTAGIASAFYTNTPIFTSFADGFWDDPATWTQTGGDLIPGGCPAGGPNGFIVNVNHVVTIRTHNCSAYRTTINEELRVEEPFFGHNFGTVYGSGTLHLERGTFPAGVFTSFLSCASGGTVDYGGTGTYTIIADLYDNIPNLKFTGTGTRVLPNKDLIICDTLTIDGPVVDNSVYNKKLTIQGGMKHLSGSFNAGTGAGAIVSFAGTIPQTIGGLKLGNFTGASAFNHLEINNAAGLRVNDLGAIEVKGNLMLTNGLINTGSNRTLTITNSAINCVVPSGGSATSFVDGPLTKNISQYDNFLFPIGIDKSGTKVLGNKLNISSAQPGPALWTAQYYNPNPTSTLFTPPILGVSAMEYFTINSAAGSKAKININWTPTSDVNPVIVGGIGNMRVVKYSGGSWIEVPTTTSGNNSNGTASSTNLVTLTGDDDYSLGSVTTLIPRAAFNPVGPVCGTAGIPVSFTAPGAIPTDYLLSYSRDGAPQTPVTITSLMLPYTLPTPVSGTYKLTGFTYNSGAGIGVVDGTPVTTYPTPTTADAGVDQIKCGVSFTKLEANTPVVGTGFWTRISGTGETIWSPSNPTSDFTGLNGNKYTLRWTISSGTCTSFDEVDISFTTLPNAPVAVSPQRFCNSATVANLVATAPALSTVDWYDADTPGGTLLPPGTPLTDGATYYAESNAGCVSLTRTPVQVIITQPPVSPTISSTNPGIGSTVCTGYNTGTITFAPGSGEGTDELQYSTDGGTTWLTYVNGSPISTSGASNSVQVRARRIATVCASTAYTQTLVWNIGTATIAPTLGSATPVDGSIVCEGYNTGFVVGAPGSGGSSGAADEYRVSINGGSGWTPYTSGSNILTTGATGTVIVQARRTGGSYDCTDTPWSTLCTWTLGSAPVSPSLSSATPVSGTTICAGYNGPSAVITAGSGGSTGAADLYEYTINNGVTWLPYTSGALINTTGAVNNVMVRVSRSGGSYGCTGTGTTTIATWPVASPIVAPTLSSATPANGSTVCAGYDLGTVTGTAGSGGSAASTDKYQLSIDGGTSYNPYTNGDPIVTTGATGNIIVQAQRTGGGFGCSDTPWNTICTWTLGTPTINPALNIATPASGTAICEGFNGPNATITAGSGGSSGATDLYEYSINNGSSWLSYVSGSTINALGAVDNVLIRVSRSGGIYGCAGTGPVTIVSWPVTQKPGAAGAISGTAAVCQGQSLVAYNVGVITGATSYTWTYTGTGITINGTGNSITIDFSGTATSGNLTVSGTNSCGNGTVSAIYPITVSTIPSVPVASVTIQPTCAVSTGTIVITSPLGAQYEYGIDGGSYQASPTFTGVAAGNHTLTARLIAPPNCESATSAPLTVNPVPTPPAVPTTSSVTQPTCAVPTGTIVFTAQAGVEYSVGGAYQASPTFAGLAPNTYTLTVRSTADNTCITAAAATVTLTAATPPAVPTTSSVTQPTCAVPTGTIVFTAQAGVEYSVGGAYQASPTFAGLAPNTYTLTVRSTADNTCITAAAATVTLTAATPPAVPTTSSVTQPTCAVPTGTIVFTAQAGVEYSVGGAYQASPTFAGLAPNTYTLTVRSTADNTCITAAAATVTLTAATPPAVPTTSSVTQPTCAVPTGTIVFTAQAGVEYSVGGAYQASPTFAGLAPNTYTLTVRSTADNTCITAAAATVTLTAATPPAVPTTSSVTQPTCAVPTGTIVFTAQAGVEYSVGGAYQASPTFAGLAPNTYTLTVRSTADNTCITAAAATVTLTAATPPAVPTTSSVTQPTCAVPTGTIVFTAQAGVEYSVGGAYQASPTFAGLAPNTYTLTVRSTADNTCITAAAATVTLTAASAIGASAGNNGPVCEATSLSLTGNPNGMDSYSWTGPNGFTSLFQNPVVSATATPVMSGIYTLTVTLGGCTEAVTTTATVTPFNTITLTSGAGTNSQTVCLGDVLTTITYTTTGATGASFTGLPTGLSVSWAGNTVTISGTPTSVGDYTYNIDLSGGCGLISETGTISVKGPNSITLSSALGTDGQTVCNNSTITDITYSTVSATGATVSGLPTGVNGAWASDVFTISGTPTVTGTFPYTITTTGGCGVATASGSITVNPVLPVSVSIAADVNPICAGSTVTFTATPTNGGLTPSYQWYNGATAVGGNSPTYAYVPSNGDVITVVLTGSETCQSGSPATSNAVTMTVNPVLPVSVSISADVNPICSGSTVTFTATPVNGGTTPSYQWYNGATAVGANSPTYAYVPANGDAITVVLTSSETCQSGGPATSAPVAMVVNPLLPVSVSITADANPVCAGTTVTFTATPTNGGTTPSYQWYNGATAVGANSATYAYVPANGDVITVVLTSSETCTSGNPATSNAVTMTVNPILPVSVSIAADVNPICAGSTVTFTATPTNGGLTPSYQWYNGATAVGGNSPTYAYVPSNGDVITVVLTGSETCQSGSPATSNAVTMTVNPVLPVSVSISADVNPICSGSTVTFTATPVNGGTTPSYQWYNGATAVGANSPTYAYVPANGDAITVVLTSSETCQSGGPATSAPVAMVVNPLLPVSVSITADANPVCAGTTVTFTATPTNGGTTPSYQWYNGATAVGANSATYAYVPANGDVITVVLTSSETCTSGNPATSNAVTMTVNPILPVSVSIAADVNPICAGSTVTFTATPTNGGLTPSYQWYNGATAVGGNSPTYAYVPSNGDVITVVLTGSETCQSGSPATSNAVTMTVNPVLPVSVSISADVNPICSGSTVTFTATPVNGGTTPSYQWYNGATAVGANSPTYAYVPANGDAITVVLTSSETCQSGGPATSAPVAMVVNPLLPVSVSITADANPVCAGTTVTFTATPTNGGTTPSYQWYNGATAVGANSATYAYVPANGDVITVVLTSSETCTSGNPATSNAVTMTVNPILPVSVSITADVNPICAGSTVTFTATPTNGGLTPSYQWYNGATAIGGNSPTYAYVPSNGDVITVVLTGSETCQSGSPATSNAVTMTVNPVLPVSVSISADVNPICSGSTVTFTATPVNGGTTPSYQWYNGSTAVGANSPTYAYVPANGDVITVVLTSGETCASGNPATSNAVTIIATSPATASATVTNVACFNGATGAVDLILAGGTSPFTYLWSNGATSEDIAGLTAGNYTVVITDAAGCVVNASGNVTQPASALSGSVTSQTNVTVTGGNDGSLTVDGTGGTSPYLFSLNGGAYQASGTFGTLIAAVYTVTIQDMNLCTFDVPVTITEPVLPLTGTFIQTDVLCFGDATGSVTITGAGGVLPHEFSLDGGAFQSSGIFGTLTAGPHAVTIRDAAATTTVINFTIMQPASAVSVTTSEADITCNGAHNGMAVAIPSGGTGAYTYSWNTTPVQTNDTISGLDPGSYAVTVTDANLCSSSANVTITEPAVLAVNAVPTDASCPDVNDGQIALEITGGTPVYSIFWSDGGSEMTKTNLLPGTYSVAISDGNGCTASANATVGFEGTYNCVQIPQILTPEPADGHNDLWIIRNIDIYPRAEIKVYSRWGKLIYHTKNPSAEPWNGRYFNGKLVPTDSYRYILDLHDGSEPRSGVISVIR